uniref:Uncharacterized protein n=1 Tax=Sphaerodactylus townsendi TaxID=933632 RepID=A0ACB8FRJ5_9SAUR
MQRKRRALPLPAGELPAPPQPGQLPAAPQPGQLPAAPQPGQLPAAPQPGQFPAQQPFLKNFGGSKFGKKLRDGSKFGKKFCRCPESKPVTEAPAPTDTEQFSFLYYRLSSSKFMLSQRIKDDWILTQMLEHNNALLLKSLQPNQMKMENH